MTHILTRGRRMVVAGWSGMMVRNTSRGRRGWGNARHYRSAECEDDGVLNALHRGEWEHSTARSSNVLRRRAYVDTI